MNLKVKTPFLFACPILAIFFISIIVRTATMDNNFSDIIIRLAILGLVLVVVAFGLDRFLVEKITPKKIRIAETIILAILIMLLLLQQY